MQNEYEFISKSNNYDHRSANNIYMNAVKLIIENNDFQYYFKFIYGNIRKEEFFEFEYKEKILFLIKLYFYAMKQFDKEKIISLTNFKNKNVINIKNNYLQTDVIQEDTLVIRKKFLEIKNYADLYLKRKNKNNIK